MNAFEKGILIFCGIFSVQQAINGKFFSANKTHPHSIRPKRKHFKTLKCMICEIWIDMSLDRSLTFVQFWFNVWRYTVCMQERTLHWPLCLASCGGILTNSSGIITSPGFPNSYANNLLCDWDITGPVGKKIAVTFTDMELEHLANTCFDKIQVSPGASNRTETWLVKKVGA